MRGADAMQESLFTVAKLEDFVPSDHPLRAIRVLVNDALAAMSARFNDPRQLIVHLHAFDVATSQCMKTAFSCDTNGCVCADATPWQADHQSLQLLVGDRQAQLGSRACPNEPALMQSP